MTRMFHYNMIMCSKFYKEVHMYFNCRCCIHKRTEPRSVLSSVRPWLPSVMKLAGAILVAFIFGACVGSEDFCPKGSRLFLLDPNPDGTCPEVLPTVETPEEEDENPCAQVSKENQESWLRGHVENKRYSAGRGSSCRGAEVRHLHGVRRDGREKGRVQ